VLYGGYGAVGFDRSELGEASSYIPDFGVGFQASFSLRNYQFFWSALVAQALEEDNNVRVKFSFKSYH
jgi:hypothetical protein